MATAVKLTTNARVASVAMEAAPRNCFLELAATKGTTVPPVFALKWTWARKCVPKLRNRWSHRIRSHVRKEPPARVGPTAATIVRFSLQIFVYRRAHLSLAHAIMMIPASPSATTIPGAP